MPTPPKRILITIVAIAVPAMALRPVLLPRSDEIPDPSGLQVPALVFLGACEALALGFGLAMLVHGLPVARRAARRHGSAVWGAFGSAVWLLSNWWLHDALHLFNGPSLNGLIAIEYAFHITSMASGVLLALSLLWLTRDRLTSGEAPGVRT